MTFEYLNSMAKGKHIAVFCGSSLPHDEEIVASAALLGSRIAQAGYTLVYGGSNLGLMGVLSGAALASKGYVVGVIPTLFSDDIINSQSVTSLVRVRSMAERKEWMLKMCDVFIALPGGIGTIDEVSEVLVMNQLQIVDGKRVLDGTYHQRPMILLNVGGYFNPFLEQLHRAQISGLMHGSAGLVALDTVPEILAYIDSSK